MTPILLGYRYIVYHVKYRYCYWRDALKYAILEKNTVKKIKTCMKCGDEFKPDIMLKDTWFRYCPYCDVVETSEPDKKWLPSIKSDEIKGGGFHKV